MAATEVKQLTNIGLSSSPLTKQDNPSTTIYKTQIIPGGIETQQEYSTDSLVISNLTNKDTYFIRFQIDRMTTETATNLEEQYLNLIYDIWLGSYSNTDQTFNFVQQIKNNQQVPSGKGAGVSTTTNIDVIFNINTSNINSICIQLNPIMYDYQTPKESNPRATWLSDGHCNVFVYKVNNLISNLNAIKVGVQAEPGRLIIINKQPIRVGKSGVYEINNGLITVKYFSIIPELDAEGDAEAPPPFILDYVNIRNL